MPPYREPTKVSQACSYCRKRKVKCDGEAPCGNCLDHGQPCKYSPLQRRGRRNYGERNNIRVDSLVNSTETIPQSNHRGGRDLVSSDKNLSSPRFAVPESTQPFIFSQSNLDGSSRFTPDVAAAGPTDRMPTMEIAPSPRPSREVLPVFDSGNVNVGNSGNVPTPHDSEVDREEATMDLQAINWEHHGPGSWLSICSGPGRRWVSARTGTTDIDTIAHDLIIGWTQRLTLAPGTIRERCPDPDVGKAWTYVAAFFERSHDSVFGVVFRPDFEARLRLHFQGSNPHDEDTAWYALRNAVYAVGCQTAAPMDGTRSFAEVQKESLRFFHNAFSVLSDLLYMPSGLMAVQALTVMTSFAELLGSPAVEYMLCASAARLAQSKGLHRQPSRAWNLPTLQVLQRSWIFWAIYCYEKYIALRSGRPSVLEDDEISCEIPSSVPERSTIDIGVFTAMIAHAQICSKMIKQLFSVKAFSHPSDIIIENVRTLEEKLQEWRSFYSHLIPMKYNIASQEGDPYRRQANVSRLHYFYWGSMITLHANFHYPWICSVLVGKEPSFPDRISHSSAQAAEASRQILSALKDTNFDMSFSSPIAFYFPMLAVINLFIYILKDPTLEGVQSDLALLDIAAGHFANIHFLTSAQVSFTFPREIASVANKAVKKARLKNTEPAGKNHPFAHTPETLPADPSEELPSVLDVNATLEELNTFSNEFFKGLSDPGDMIIF